MSDEHDWNDVSRDNLRANLRWCIHGELRLMRRDHGEILDACREIYVVDECPESEQQDFVQFAVEELQQFQAQLESEMSGWPVETDCDRLDRVEANLRDQGILLWQASPCCDNCTLAELPDRIDLINDRDPGFRDRIRGYAFFIDQNMADRLSESTKISLYLAYGWLYQDDAEVSEEVYQTNALGIAREVSESLQEEGIEVHWDGNLARKIGICINWQRREMLD